MLLTRHIVIWIPPPMTMDHVPSLPLIHLILAEAVMDRSDNMHVPPLSELYEPFMTHDWLQGFRF